MVGRILGCVLLGGLIASVSLQAHHSLAGVYDMRKDGEVSGALTQIKLSNPHGSLTVAVKNADGTTTDWVMTTGSATSLAQRGIGRSGPNAFAIGETITVKFLAARNGSPLGFLKTVIRADGRVVQISAGNDND